MNVKWYFEIEPFGKKYLSVLEKYCDAEILYNKFKNKLNINIPNNQITKNDNMNILGKMVEFLIEKENDPNKKKQLINLLAEMDKIPYEGV